MRFEKDQGSGDDTAANGFNFIFCNKFNWYNRVEKIYQGLWGDWRSKVYCPVNSFVIGMQVRF